ncbi:hypothetical protein, partial [Pseudonocardia sulfidoxydans]
GRATTVRLHRTMARNLTVAIPPRDDRQVARGCPHTAGLLDGSVAEPARGRRQKMSCETA